MTRLVVIAGGAGFIGSHLADAHIAQGDDVTIIDDLSTGRAANVPVGATLIAADLTIDDPWTEADLIYHLASPASPQAFAAHPIHIMRCGSTATETLLRLADLNTCRLVLASTSEVYGDPHEHPQNEGYAGNVDPTGPRGCYDEAKRYAEALCLAYHRSHGTDVRIARIFNTYGPRMPRDGRLVPEILDALDEHRPVRVHGDGLQTRSLCYVADMVRGMMLLAESDTAGPFPVNLGSDEEHSVGGVVYEALTLAGRAEEAAAADPSRRRPLTERVQAMPDDPRRRRPDLCRARLLLGYEPQIGLREGLQRTLRDAGWYRGSSSSEGDSDTRPRGATSRDPGGASATAGDGR